MEKEWVSIMFESDHIKWIRRATHWEKNNYIMLKAADSADVSSFSSVCMIPDHFVTLWSKKQVLSLLLTSDFSKEAQ